MKIRTHDTVLVLTGKDRGKTGVITKIVGENKVIVEGVNKMVKHIKGRNGQPGERVEFFAPIHVSNVSLLDPKTGTRTRVGYTFEGNKKFRIAQKSKERIVVSKAKKAPAKKSTPSESPKK